MHLQSTAVTPVGRYENEYAMFLTFSHDGNKISRHEEMVDSKFSEEHFLKMRKHLRKHGGDVETAWANAVTTASL